MDHDPDPRSVFIVDDDEAIRISLSRALRMRGFDVRAFDSAASFLAAHDDLPPGCLVLDYGMPGMNGLELQRQLNDRCSPLPIIFVTGHGGIPESVQAIKDGAVDFLEKPFRQADLVERIGQALKMARSMHRERRALREVCDRFARLTPREQQIVEHILANPAEVSSKEIGRHLDISPRTVDHHRARILEKLRVGSVVELIDLVLRASHGTQRPRRGQDTAETIREEDGFGGSESPA
ncbi:response regulator transcription factor [Paracoccus stylophorae]|uniref:Response regulator transcription factor n=1 Tax=Paracoccus stylophorae TaxID=659350 RepID=A0ABY7SUB0_9RHOB|nr:response regulator [Paracoccus stylophorae]WCR10635.1 response regulator transcription factor [Paracoccus stylophorae]